MYRSSNKVTKCINVEVTREYKGLKIRTEHSNNLTVKALLIEEPVLPIQHFQLEMEVRKLNQIKVVTCLSKNPLLITSTNSAFSKVIASSINDDIILNINNNDQLSLDIEYLNKDFEIQVNKLSKGLDITCYLVCNINSNIWLWDNNYEITWDDNTFIILDEL